MRNLFDQCTPQPLRQHLPAHQVVSARERGWDGFQNGRLIQAAELDGFDLLVSADQSIRYQQNLTGRRLALLVLTSPLWPKLEPHATAIAPIVNSMKPGEYREFVVS